MNSQWTVTAASLTSREAVKQRVDERLADIYAQQVNAAREVSAQYVELWQSIADLALAGGKRIRPYLCILAYEACGGSDTATILDIAVAQELLHTALLIHDDIIDRDTVRYGRANLSGIYRAKYGAMGAADAGHYADSAALLAGDLLFSLAHMLIADIKLPAADIQTAQRCLQQAMFTVAAGELHDSESTLLPPEAVDPIMINRLKTAGYSFVGPLTCGAGLAHADESTLAALQSYGTNIGIAYQLADDILGAFGDSAQTGKPASSDFEEGKMTYLLQTALRDTAAAEVLTPTIGKPMDDAMLALVRKTLQQSGALSATQSLARRYQQSAVNALQGLAIDAPAMAALNSLADKAIDRTV